MSYLARYSLAALVGWTTLCASALAAAAAEGASGTLSLTTEDGEVPTLEVRHGYLFEAPDPFGGEANVRVLVLTDEDVRGTIEACGSGRCAELAAKNALVVKLWSDGSPPAFWAHVESTQYSAPLSGPGLRLDVDTPARIAGTIAIDTKPAQATISFDTSRLKVFTALD